MADGVEYRVSTTFEAVDKASRNLREIGDAAQKSASATIGLGEALKGLAVGFGAVKLFEAGKHALFGLNNELSKHTTTLAGLNKFYTNANMEVAWSRAAKSLSNFNELSWKSGAPVEKMLGTLKELQLPLMQAGMKFKDIEQFVHDAVDAAGPLGLSEESVTSSIQGALIRPKMAMRDTFIRGLLAQGGIGVDPEKFAEMSMAKRASILQKALSSKSMEDFKDKEGATFEGAKGDIMSHIDKLLTATTKPLFDVFTKELVNLRSWIENNRESLEATARTIGEGLVKAFGVVKEIATTIYPIMKEMGSVLMNLISFAADHKDSIIALAKALIVLKVGEKIGGLAKSGAASLGGMFGGVAGGIGGGIGQMADGFKGLKEGTGGLKDAFGNLANIIGGAGGIVGVFGKLATAGWAIYKIATAESETTKKQRETAHGQAVAATEFKGLVEERDRLKSSLSKLGWDPMNPNVEIKNASVQADVDRLKQLEANYDVTAAKLLAEGKKTGIVKEKVSGEGVRQLSLWNKGPDTTVDNYQEVFKDHAQTMDALNILFKEESNRIRYAMRDTAMGVRALHPDEVLKDLGYLSEGGTMFNGGAMLGAFAEKVIGTKSAEAEPQAIVPEVKQTVNITIQRVMAKDPNRWLAEMDDMVKEKTRAGTRAKGSWKPSPR